MTPDDPRHGTHAGYKAHQRDDEQPCQPCRDAAALYQYERERDRLAGVHRTVPALGFRRRVEALRAIGWSTVDIAEAAGLDVRNLPATCARQWVRYSTHARLAEAYERMCMSPPTDKYARRRRSIALRRGCTPPLAWDDIDRDDAPSTGEPVDLDEVAVQRAYDGDLTVRLTRRERAELVRRWISDGRPWQVLHDRGINVSRELRATREREAA